MKSNVRVNHIARQHGEHNHEFAQILFGYRGHVECELDKGGFHLDERYALLLPSNSDHFYVGRDFNSKLIVIDIPLNDSLIQYHYLGNGIDMSAMIQEKVQFRAIDEFSHGVLRSVDKYQGGWQQCNDLVRHQTAILLIASFFNSELAGQQSRAFRHPTVSEEVINRWIDERLGQPPTLEQLSNFLNMSVSAMTALFNAHFGMSPKRYVMARRMMWATCYIGERNYSLSQVAYELGFSSQSAFTRAFSRYYGYPPGRMKNGTVH
ncbi:AraC family transcriptional regulator [Halomonas piscis]|uniref:AraC family transcriptional regulator n=1 Tax=Halomonas piscis TaxID=3031727 RepID=UPI0028991989|nr:AraC family transcriptional regulator [Halomonas piscis]